MGSSSGGEGQLAGGVERELEGDLAVMAAGELEGGDLEGALDGAEVGDDDLPVANGASEYVAAHSCVGSAILEDAGARDPGVLDARSRQQLAPLPGRFRVRDVDGLGVEGDRA